MSQRRGNRLEARQQDNMLHLTHESVEEHSPYPPAELVRAYEDIEAGMANRMMQMSPLLRFWRLWVF